MPAGTPCTVNIVAELPVGKSARFDRFGPEPARTTYEAGVQPCGAIHCSVTVAPDTVAVRPLGLSSTPVHGGSVARPTGICVAAPEPEVSEPPAARAARWAVDSSMSTTLETTARRVAIPLRELRVIREPPARTIVNRS